MNSPVPPASGAKRKQAALIGILGVSVLLGIVDAALATSGDGSRLAFTLIGNIGLLVLGFRWLAIDALELDIRRPTWLNVGIILLAAVFVPYYLYKTRPEGRRLPAIGGFFGLVFACMLGSALGAVLMGLVSGTTPAA